MTCVRSSTKALRRWKTEGVIRLFKSYRPDYRDGEQKRDFLSIKDAVAMTLHLAADEKAGGLFNIGSGQARDVAGFGALGFRRAKTRAENRIRRDARSDSRQVPVFHGGQAVPVRRAAGYAAPVTSLEDAVADYVGNHLVPDRRLDLGGGVMLVGAEVTRLLFSNRLEPPHAGPPSLFWQISPPT